MQLGLKLTQISGIKDRKNKYSIEKMDRCMTRFIIISGWKISKAFLNINKILKQNNHTKENPDSIKNIVSLRGFLGQLKGSGTKIIKLDPKNLDRVAVRFKQGLGSIEGLEESINFWFRKLNQLDIKTLSCSENDNICESGDNCLLVFNQRKDGIFGSTFRDSPTQYRELISQVEKSRIISGFRQLRRISRTCAKNGILTPFDCFCFWYSSEGEKKLEFGIGDYDYMKYFSKNKHLIYPLLAFTNKIMVELYILNFVFPKTLALALSTANILIVRKLRTLSHRSI